MRSITASPVGAPEQLSSSFDTMSHHDGDDGDDDDDDGENGDDDDDC